MYDVRPAAAAGASRRELMIHELLTSSRSDGGAAAMFALEIVVSMAVRYIRGGVPAGWVCTRWRCIHRLIGIDRAVLPLFCARVCIDGIVFYVILISSRATLLDVSQEEPRGAHKFQNTVHDLSNRVSVISTKNIEKRLSQTLMPLEIRNI
jgi:hypothetical protein